MFGHYSSILESCGQVILKGPIWIFLGGPNSLLHGSACKREWEMSRA